MGFDIERFAQMLEAQRIAKGLLGREMAREVGVSPSTVSRVLNGEIPDVSNLILFLAWAQLEFNEFITTPAPTQDTLRDVATALARDAALGDGDAVFIAEIVQILYRHLVSRAQ